MQQIQPINSWRMYGKVIENKITVELPVGLNSQEVEIFIFPKKADIFIAATAISRNFLLATFSLNHFKRIQNFRLLNIKSY